MTILSLVAAGGWLKTAWKSPVFRALTGAGATLLAVWAFHSWSVAKGVNKCEGRVDKARFEEVQRQLKVARSALDKAAGREEAAEKDAERLAGAHEKALEAARNSANSGQVCLSKEVTDALKKIE